MTAPLLVIGRSGQLARALSRLEPDAITLSRKTLDISDSASISRILGDLLDRQSIRAVINAAAYTHVDQAESDKVFADRINAAAPEIIAQLCDQHSVPFVHVSTDYVFNGTNTRPYREDDPTNPVNFYGESKLGGERGVLNTAKKAAILRTSWVYDLQGKNFVTTMLRLAEERDELRIVCDQIGRPTHANVLAEACIAAIGHEGIFHVSGTGDPVSWAEFAKEIFEAAGKTINVVPIPTSDYPTPAKRPAYSVLDTSKFESEIGPLPDWRDTLRESFSRTG